MSSRGFSIPCLLNFYAYNYLSLHRLHVYRRSALQPFLFYNFSLLFFNLSTCAQLLYFTGPAPMHETTIRFLTRRPMKQQFTFSRSAPNNNLLAVSTLTGPDYLGLLGNGRHQPSSAINGRHRSETVSISQQWSAIANTGQLRSAMTRNSQHRPASASNYAVQRQHALNAAANICARTPPLHFNITFPTLE